VLKSSRAALTGALIPPTIHLRHQGKTMNTILRASLLMLLAMLPFAQVRAADDADYAKALEVFQSAGESSHYFRGAYGYALFPTVGKAGLGIGGARGKGRVYKQGAWVGNTTLTQLSVGFQAGGQAYSQIIFFEDQRAFDEFTGGNFEFGAQATAVAITAGVSGTASTTGSSAGASGGQKDATTVGKYYKGMAVFTVAKGGLMYEASIGGQKFSYKPR
jgi:lipid-binding SYLF domain-containing protein